MAVVDAKLSVKQDLATVGGDDEPALSEVEGGTVDSKRKERKKSSLADLTCTVCAKEYRWSYRLIEHMRVHTREKPYKCETCCASFSLKSNLVRHQKVQHTTGTAKHACAICAKVFKETYLKRHMERVHKDVPAVARGETAPSVLDVRKMVSKKKGSGKSPLADHTCAVCAKEFRYPSDLILHVRVHTREKPYKCETCCAAFSLKSNLVRHRKVRHTTGTAKQSCAICAKVFKETDYLKQHMKRVHKDVPTVETALSVLDVRKMVSKMKGSGNSQILADRTCTVCGRECAKPAKLIEHMRVHTVVKTRSPGISHHTKSQPADKSHSQTLHSPEIRLTRVLRSPEFACRICKETFTSRDHLVAHSETHSFDHLKCVICGKYFSNRFDLNCHLQMCARALDC